MSKTDNFSQQIIEIGTITIPINTAISTSIDNFGTSAVGLIFPAMTSISSAFQVSVDGANFFFLTDTVGTVFSLELLGGTKAYPLNPPFFWQWRYLRLIVDFNEAAERVIQVVRRIL